MNLVVLHPADFFRVLDHRPGASLVIFTSPSCGSCRRAKAVLPTLDLRPVDAIFEVDASEAPGLVQELGFHHLPALYVWQDGECHGQVEAPLAKLADATKAALAGPIVDLD